MIQNQRQKWEGRRDDYEHMRAVVNCPRCSNNMSLVKLPSISALTSFVLSLRLPDSLTLLLLLNRFVSSSIPLSLLIGPTDSGIVSYHHSQFNSIQFIAATNNIHFILFYCIITLHYRKDLAS
ncbi:hypothetical protein MtrunA17_Chr4g0076861 [Medicago truncatula]|uniref:Transmembrane protein n=1 Tax=Medicago truncatula TaxID=3880 RepID=A0A396ILE5_MEDTR|nr:hypothetical protein MtrunA17_Chr4g0076861 [Medicago truncatula]